MPAKRKTARGRKQDRARVAGVTGLRGAIRVQENSQVSIRSKEGGQESRQQPQEG